ncbi:hypothetical protein vseg_015597 [Gypsophila vaccaria]
MMKYSKMMKKLGLDREFLHQYACFKSTSTYSPSPKHHTLTMTDKIVTSIGEDFIGEIISREQIHVTNNNNQVYGRESTKLKLKQVKRPQPRTSVTKGNGGVVH